VTVTPQYIPDIIAEVVQRVSARTEAEHGFQTFFDWGRYADVTKNLVQKEGQLTEEARRKYPLVWLVCDFPETMMVMPGVYSRTLLHLVIGTHTTPNLTMADRRDKSFLPVLYPIYKYLLEELVVTPELGYPTRAQLASHQKTDRPYWGGNVNYQDGVANMWSDFIDAVQIRNLEIQVIEICK